MTDQIEQPEDVLVAYYSALTDAETTGISKFFDSTVTVITLAGSVAVNCPEEIDKLYRVLCETWVANGLSTKIGFERSQFVKADIQDNATIVHTRLSNYTQKGDLHETWNCTYVLCKKPGGWKIALATSDNQTTAGASLG